MGRSCTWLSGAGCRRCAPRGAPAAPRAPDQAPAPAQVLAASQSPVSKAWFQGTADAVRQYMWLFDETVRDGIEDFLILAGARPPGRESARGGARQGAHAWAARGSLGIGPA